MRGGDDYLVYDMEGDGSAGRRGRVRGILRQHQPEEENTTWWVCLCMTGLGVVIIAVIMTAVLGSVMAAILLRG